MMKKVKFGSETKNEKFIDTHQAHPSKDGNSVDTFDGQVYERRYHDDEIKNVPPTPEVLLAQGYQFQARFQGEERGEHLVANVCKGRGMFDH